MSRPTDSPDIRFLKLVNEEACELRAFVELLARERQALLAGDADPLVELATQKSAAAARLAALATARRELAVAAGAAASPAGMAAWLASASRTQALRKAWTGFLELAREAHASNADNGTLIKTRLIHNRQALAVLMAASDQAALYGPDGQATPSAAARRIDSA